MHLLAAEWLSTADVQLRPKKGILVSRKDAKLQPFIFSAPMDTVTGLELTRAMVAQNEMPVVSRFTGDEYWAAMKEFPAHPNVWFAVGALQNLDTWLAQVSKLAETVPELKLNLAVDIAHGHSLVGLHTLEFLRKQPWVNGLMSGSICTPEGALESIMAGATALRVGVGPGSRCTTRLQTGFGLPQLSAVYRIWDATNWFNVPIIADGGIRTAGDAVKYIAAGATGVMMGNIFSTVEESAGWKIKLPFHREGALMIVDNSSLQVTKYKQYRGQASAEFQQDMLGQSNDCPEGVSGPQITPEGTCAEVIAEFRGGMQSAISYAGLASITDMNPNHVTFERVTGAGYQEGMPQL